jgi:flagellar protein FliS
MMKIFAQQDEYFESKVMTAPAHKLHLMLIEGAIRFGRQAEAALRRGDVEAADEPLMRTIDIVGELLVGVREMKTELNTKLAELYLFVFRRVAEAKVNDDANTLADALQLLDYERETWQLVCQKLESDPNADATKAYGNSRIDRPSMPLVPPSESTWNASSNAGLSLEA